MRHEIGDLAAVERIDVHTSAHTHAVVGSGANDPQKFDPDASRETLDHSLMYIFAVALEDGRWHHVESYTPERAHRASTVALWHKIQTIEDADWDARYHDPDPARRAFGGRAEVRLKDGETVTGELAVADAHPNGARPWRFDDYAGKFRQLTAPLLPEEDAEAFIALARRLSELGGKELRRLNPALPASTVTPDGADGKGIFDHGLG